MQTITPEKVGFSSVRLNRLDNVIQRCIDEGEAPGVLMLVARHGQVAYLKSFGRVDVHKEGSPQIDTIYRIFSMTKPITSAAVMMLHEEGRFRLDDPVSEYIPEFKQVRVYADGADPVAPERPVTIRHLLTHTAGLTYPSPNSAVGRLYQEASLWDNTPLREWIKEVAALPLKYQPGTRWHYGFAIDVLGYLVEVISGMRFGEFLSQRIFEPLGMTDTAFYVPAGKTDRFSPVYRAGLHRISNLHLGDYKKVPPFESGGAGLVGTAADYLRFCLMLRGGGELDGERLLGRKTITYMTMNHLTPDIDRAERQPGYGFGLGFDVLQDPVAAGRLSSAGEYGWGGLASTHFWIDPAEDIIAIKMSQIIHWDRNRKDVPHRDLNTNLRTAVYQALVDC